MSTIKNKLAVCLIVLISLMNCVILGQQGIPEPQWRTGSGIGAQFSNPFIDHADFINFPSGLYDFYGYYQFSSRLNIQISLPVIYGSATITQTDEDGMVLGTYDDNHKAFGNLYAGIRLMPEEDNLNSKVVFSPSVGVYFPTSSISDQEEINSIVGLYSSINTPYKTMYEYTTLTTNFSLVFFPDKNAGVSFMGGLEAGPDLVIRTSSNTDFERVNIHYCLSSGIYLQGLEFYGQLYGLMRAIENNENYVRGNFDNQLMLTASIAISNIQPAIWYQYNLDEFNRYFSDTGILGVRLSIKM